MPTAAKKTLAQKLHALQGGWESLTKDGRAQYGEYVTLNSLLDAVLPKLNEAGVLLVQAPTNDTNGGAWLQTSLLNVDDANDRVDGWFPLSGDNPQKQGSAITYARRYSLVAMLGLKAEDDDGQAASPGGIRGGSSSSSSGGGFEDEPEEKF